MADDALALIEELYEDRAHAKAMFNYFNAPSTDPKYDKDFVIDASDDEDRETHIQDAVCHVLCCSTSLHVSRMCMGTRYRALQD